MSSLRPGERIPQHDHSDRNSGGLVDGSTVVAAVGGSTGLGGSSTGSSLSVTDGSTTVSSVTEISAGAQLVVTDAGGGIAALAVSGVELNIEGGQGPIKAHGSMGSTETFDPTDGNVHTGTLDANCTFTLNAPAGSGAALLEIRALQDGTGAWTITWPGSVSWIGGTPAPDTTAGTTSIYLLESVDGGSTWAGVLVGGGGSALTIKDEGTPLATAATSIDFAGAGVVASGAAGAKTVTISGAPTGAAGGDLSGTYPNPSVVDDSHNHTSTTLPAVSPTHVHVAYETHTSDGVTTTFTLDQIYDAGSVMAWNRTTGTMFGVTEVLPDQATLTAAGAAADLIDFFYAATVL